MILTDSISISQSSEHVFDMVTDPTRIHEWDDTVVSVEILSRGAWGGCNQARWVIRLGKHNLEMVETVLKHERPTLFASKVHFIGFALSESDGTLPKNLPINSFEHTPKAEFESFLGKGKPSALLQMEFTPTGRNAMTLRLTTDHHVGGFSRVSLWCAKYLRLKPHRKKLKMIKAGAERLSDAHDG